MGMATHIAIKAIKKVPANKGTAPKASFINSGSGWPSLTKVLAGYQWVPNIKSKIFTAWKNLIASNKSEKTIPIVTKTAPNDATNNTHLRKISTGSLMRSFFWTDLYAKLRDKIKIAKIIATLALLAIPFNWMYLLADSSRKLVIFPV